MFKHLNAGKKCSSTSTLGLVISGYLSVSETQDFDKQHVNQGLPVEPDFNVLISG